MEANLNKFDEEFWKTVDTLTKSNIVIDRKKGSSHPNYPNMIYTTNYGYIINTLSPDGEGIDVFVGSNKNKVCDALICIVDLKKRESEIKLLIGCNNKEKEDIYNLLNQSPYMKAIIITRQQ